MNNRIIESPSSKRESSNGWKGNLRKKEERGRIRMEEEKKELEMKEETTPKLEKTKTA